MIYLYTATPGTGKTCYVVKQLVEDWVEDAANRNRLIYSNVEGLKVEGILPLPESLDHRDCEDGALIIIDEPQDIEHYSSDSRGINPIAKSLSKHRHRGFDIHFISQDPSLLHKYILKNVYLHYYFWRPAQRQMIEIYTFARAIVSPTQSDFKNAYDKKWWRFEERYLQYYKSTVMNTSKKVGSGKRNGVIATFVIFMLMAAYFIYPALAMNLKNEQTEEAEVLPVKQAAAPEVVTSEPVPVQNVPPPQPVVDYEALERKRVKSILIVGDKCIARNPYGHYLDLSVDECRDVMSRPLEDTYLTNANAVKTVSPEVSNPLNVQSQIDQSVSGLNPLGGD